ncbi:hypothetical protein BG57_32440 [Caballeronia grimmiae]|uniref:Uncharacterized protein n=1 Tax=Caballeronia grimmiae TaxID=1071679 RepID=A0A069PD03_9BURK|nr:hypothetical protein BG57_32440 [Caballeronia grimmiae]
MLLGQQHAATDLGIYLVHRDRMYFRQQVIPGWFCPGQRSVGQGIRRTERDRFVIDNDFHTYAIQMTFQLQPAMVVQQTSIVRTRIAMMFLFWAPRVMVEPRALH